MEFIDYDWDDIAGSFVKEGILGADFTFTTNSDLHNPENTMFKSAAAPLVMCWDRQPCSMKWKSSLK